MFIPGKEPNVIAYVSRHKTLSGRKDILQVDNLRSKRMLSTILVLVISWLAYRYYTANNSSFDVKNPQPFLIGERAYISSILRKLSDACIPPPIRVMTDYSGTFRSQVILTCTKLGVADILSDGPKSLEEIAERSGVKIKSWLHRFLRAAESIGFFSFNPSTGLWENNSLSSLLREGPSDSVKSYLEFANENIEVWLNGEKSVKDGRSSFEILHGGQTFLEHLKTSTSFDRSLVGAASDLITQESTVLDYDWGQHNRVIDLSGEIFDQFVPLLLKKYRKLVGVVVKPGFGNVDEYVKKQMQNISLDIADRLSFTQGTILDASTLPKINDNDVVIVKTFVGDLNNERNFVEKLTKLRTAIGAHKCTVIILSHIDNGRKQSLAEQLFDLSTWLYLGAQSKSKEEHEVLLRKANFELKRVIATQTSVSSLIAVPV